MHTHIRTHMPFRCCMRIQMQMQMQTTYTHMHIHMHILMHTHKLILIPYTLLHYMCMCMYMYVRVYLYRCTNSYFGLCVSSAGSDILTSFFRSMLIRFTVSSRLAIPRQRKLCIMFLPLPVSGCGSSPAGEGGRPLSLLPLPVSGLGSSPAGEGGRPIS